MKDILKKRKTELLKNMQIDVENFLKEHISLKYYCFAFDCNAEYATVSICFNTEEDFAKTLTHYQNGKYSKSYQTDEDIFLLRYNTGDWEYQCVFDYTVLEEDEITTLYQDYYDKDDYKKMPKEMMKFNYELLDDFCKTEIFKQIQKTEDFTVLCIDHEEDPDDAMTETRKHVVYTK